MKKFDIIIFLRVLLLIIICISLIASTYAFIVYKDTPMSEVPMWVWILLNGR